MNVRRASLVGLVAVFSWLLQAPPAARAVQEETAHIQFVNDTGGLGQDDPLGVTIDFYVDGEKVGSVASFDSLTVDVAPGDHDVEARSEAAGTISRTLSVDAGDTTVWTITLKKD